MRAGTSRSQYLKSKDTESEEGHTGGLQNRPLSEHDSTAALELLRAVTRRACRNQVGLPPSEMQRIARHNRQSRHHQ